MKIAIDTSCLIINPSCGLSEVVYNLVSEMPLVDNNNQFICFYNFFIGKNEISKNNFKGTDNQILRVPRRLINWLWKFNRSYIEYLLPQADIYHSLHIQIPPSIRLKKILTVHDCRYLAHPGLYPQYAVKTYREQMNVSLERANMVVTVSNFTRQELLTHFSISEDKIKVIYNGFRPYYFDEARCKEKQKRISQKYNLPKVYLLFIGILDPRKNLSRLIEALSILKKEIKDIPNLVIAGISIKQWRKSDEAKKASSLDISENIHVVGVLSKDELYCLMKESLALCYPSLYEGFGFPPLEAMSIGVPVLAGNCSSIPEVSGNAACMIDPTNVNDIVSGLQSVIFDFRYRQKLIKRGLKQFKKFSWNQTATEYMNLYKRVMVS